MKETKFKSTEIAAEVNKHHKNLMRDIRALLDESFDIYSEEDCEFVHMQFLPSTYWDKRGKSNPSFEITHAGLALLLPQYHCKEAKRLFVSFVRSTPTLTAESES